MGGWIKCISGELSWFLKMGWVGLGHFRRIIKWTWEFSPQNLKFGNFHQVLSSNSQWVALGHDYNYTFKLEQNLWEKFSQMVEIVREGIFHTPSKSNLTIQQRLTLAYVTRCSRLGLWVGYFIYFKFTRVSFYS